MPRAEWALRHRRPCVQVVLTLARDGQPFPRTLLADTGAGSQFGGFELILAEADCVLCGGSPLPPRQAWRRVHRLFPDHLLSVELPALGFAKNLRVVGVPAVSAGFNGLACFSFLNRFHYGNFGKPDVFGLES